MILISSLWSRPAYSECPLPTAGRTCVLVVEDDLLIGAMASEALEEAGFAVLTAASAEEAEVILAHEAVDVLFSDIDLGGQDGCELACKALKAQPHLAVVLASGRSRRCHADRIPEGVAFLAKPYRVPQMVGEVQRAMQGAPSP